MDSCATAAGPSLIGRRRLRSGMPFAERSRDFATRASSDLHVWSIGPGLVAAEISLVSHEPKEPAVYKDLLSGLGLAHVTTEVHRCPGDPCS